MIAILSLCQILSKCEKKIKKNWKDLNIKMKLKYRKQ